MTNIKDFRLQDSRQKKRGKHARAEMEMKQLMEAGIAPDETHSQDADRHHKEKHQKPE